VDESGDVGFDDVLSVLSSWGPCAAPCPADLDGDETAALADVLLVLANWGPC
jgi:hypothetical protein